MITSKNFPFILSLSLWLILSACTPSSQPVNQANSPRSVIPTPTGTVAPTATMFTPTLNTIPSTDLTTIDTLSSGLKIVYAETDAATDETDVWLSNVETLEKRKQVVSFIHKERYSPLGQVSPDGDKLWYAFTPPNSSGSEAQIGLKEVSVVDDIENSSQPTFIKTINGFVKWLPDNKTLVYSVNNDDGLGNVETKLYLRSISNADDRLIFTANNFSFTLVSFLDEQTMLYFDKKEIDLTEVRTLDLVSGSTTLLREINIPRPWASYAISPDNTQLLILPLESNELTYISLTTDETKTILSYPYQVRHQQKLIFSTGLFPNGT